MSLDNFNKWLTLAANIGVVAGIVFLALEINQSSKATQSATYQIRMNEMDQSLREFALSESISDIYEKIDTEGVDSLTPSEWRRAHSWERARMARMQANLYQYQLGFLDTQSYEALLQGGLVSLPLWKEFGITSIGAFSGLVSELEAAARR